MNKAQSRHYSLLFQEDADLNEDILSIHNDKISDEDDDDDDEDDGFKSMIGDDEDPDIDVDDDAEEGDGSDEEIFNSNQHRSLINDGGLRLGAQSNFGRKNEYCLLTNTNEVDEKPVSLGFETPLSNVWTPTPMSPVRRAFFLASIMFGVLVIAVFLWALPCDVQPCDSELRLGPRQWFSEIDNIGLNYSTLLEKINGDLSIFGSFYKVEQFYDYGKNRSEESSQKLDITPRECGVLRLSEETGKERWRMMLEECPQHINCDLIDATGDGLPDCLILGYKSMAVMFEPIYGSIFWHIHVHGKNKGILQPDEYHFDVPIMLQDLDGDGFADLLFSVHGLVLNGRGTGGQSHLVLVSGRTGAVIGKPYSIASCHKILQIYREDVSLGYSCSMENRSELIGKIPLTTLINEINKNLDQDKFHNETTEFKNSKLSPEMNDAVCQVKYVNKGKCPYCKTRIELGMTSDNPVYKDFEYSTVVSWKILSSANVCKGALLKLWKWDVNSLQEAFIENTPSTDSSTSSTLKKPVRKELALDLDNFDESQIDYKNIFSNQPSDEAAYRDEESFTEDYISKKSYFDKSRRQAEQTYDFVMHNRHNKKLSSISNSDVVNHKAKRFYEHPITHKHKGHQTSSDHESIGEDMKRSSTTPAPSSYPLSIAEVDSLSSDPTLLHSSISPPAGYHLQRLEEVLVLLLFNGSDWSSKDLGSMIIYQLCQNQCIPSHDSQEDTVLIDMNWLQRLIWDFYISSSTFSSYKKDSRNSTAVWSLESYVRKLIIDVGNINDRPAI